jgi:2-polyprenyl-3-methyl-5-hydroxy-6-metoxy-1,4-benzoquinol methylase
MKQSTSTDLARTLLRTLLGRKPQSKALTQTVEQITHDFLIANHTYDALNIEVDVPPAILKQMFKRIKSEWSALGETEPYWSVITSDEFRSKNIKQHLGSFLESGKTNVEWMQNIARRNGVTLGDKQTCLELGCGVGRVTLPLSEVFDHVTGFDVSPGNLAECDALIKAKGANNITTHLMTEIEAIHSAPGFDVLFSVIVLQHNPPPVQKYLLEVLLAKIKPGGAAYFQLPTYLPGYAFNATEYLASSEREMEMHAVPMKQVLKLLHENSFEVLEVIQDQFTGLPGSHSFFATKCS